MNLRWRLSDLRFTLRNWRYLHAHHALCAELADCIRGPRLKRQRLTTWSLPDFSFGSEAHVHEEGKRK
jgi:hypothetical protein